MNKIQDLHSWVADNVFTFTEAALYLGITRQAISKAVKNDKLKAIKNKFILKADLDDYAKNSSRQA